MYVFALCLWLVFVFGLLFHLLKKYLYADLFNKESIEKRRLEIQKEKEYLSQKQIAIDLAEGNKIANKFNWGAFLIPLLWGLYFGAGKNLLICLIPILLLPNIIFGINANKWALAKYYRPIETYIFEQKLFIIIGVILNLIFLPLIYETIALK